VRGGEGAVGAAILNLLAPSSPTLGFSPIPPWRRFVLRARNSAAFFVQLRKRFIDLLERRWFAAQFRQSAR
jgi:hypothetical protein